MKNYGSHLLVTYLSTFFIVQSVLVLKNQLSVLVGRYCQWTTK
jgi:hypothetical protein